MSGSSTAGTFATVVAVVVPFPASVVVVAAGFFVLLWFLNELHGVVVVVVVDVVVVVVVVIALAFCMAATAPTGGVPGMPLPVMKTP